jgi:hypothetical protein
MYVKYRLVNSAFSELVGYEITVTLYFHRITNFMDLSHS